MYYSPCRAAALLFCTALAALSQSRAAYTCSTFAFSEANSNIVITGINRKGQVIGQDPNGGYLRDRNGAVTPLVVPGAITGNARPQAINNLGQIVGDFDGGDPGHGFLREADGSYREISLPVPDPSESYLNSSFQGINDQGEIVGLYQKLPYIKDFTFFRQSSSGDFINFDGHTEGVFHSFGPYWTSINNSGQILEKAGVVFDGYFYQGGGQPVNYLRFPGIPPYMPQATPVDLNPTPIFTSGLNNLGYTAGTLRPLGSGFIRTPDGHFPAVVCPDAVNASMTVGAINDLNEVAGTLTEDGRTEAFIATPTGISPQVELSEKSWTFGPHPVGSDEPRGRIYLSNKGPADLHVQAIYVGPVKPVSPGESPLPEDSADSFDIISTNCAKPTGRADFPYGLSTVTAGGWCYLDFKFAPKKSGWQTAAIYITDDSPDSPHVITLGGTGTATALQLSNESWYFGGHPVGYPTNDAHLYIYNPTGRTAHITSVLIEGAEAGQFSVTSNDCSNLTAYTTCVVRFRFNPTQVGDHSAVLLLNGDGFDSPHPIPIGGYAY